MISTNKVSRFIVVFLPHLCRAASFVSLFEYLFQMTSQESRGRYCLSLDVQHVNKMIRLILITSLMVIIHGMKGAVDVCVSYGNYKCNQSPPVFRIRLPSFCDTLPGVSISLLERVNPYQPSSFTCYVQGISPPDASLVDLYRPTGSTYNKTGIETESSTDWAVGFDVQSVYPEDFGGYQCRLCFENNIYYSELITNATYVLPVLESKVEVSSTSTTVGLQWNAWSDGDDIGDPPLVGYDVFVQNDGKCVAVQRVDQPTTSAIVINLTSDTDYIFCVAAVREGTGGTGPVSLSHSTMTRCGKPSASPTGLKVAAINPKELELTWEHLPTESAECRSGVTHYMIYYVSTGSTSLNSLLVPNDTSSYTLRGLDTYLEYTIQLTASNKDEEGDKSSETASKTLEEVAPAPINLTIPKITTSSFTVSWSTPLPSNINGNIQKYTIRFKRTDPAVDGNYEMEEVWTSAFDGEHTVMKLSGEIDYTVQVQTVNGAGSSNWSEPVHAGEDNGSNIPLELVIGGVIGLLVIITLLIFTALMYKRIKQRRLKAEPIASPPNNAPEPSVEYENPVFDDTNQDPHSYENLNTDDQPIKI